MFEQIREKLKILIQDVKDKIVPKQVNNNINNYKKWRRTVPKELKVDKNKKHRLWTRYMKTRQPELKSIKN